MRTPKPIRKYLASLDDAGRDRVIQATEWQTLRMGDEGGPRCMVGHAEPDVIVMDALTFSAAIAFDDLAAHCGLDAAVRQVKLCAGRRNRISLPQQPERAVERVR